ncbi:helix-turn-helix domain-containing protein [Streptomyces sp. NPDC090106]|uniref:helix-turn-helix domain-containing protein n=1 Tax=Streptomyces sp. NPDC090106 TaxID=3365946 RepID=UPI0037F1A494
MSEDTAAAEFAGLLRELKDRSGLSYGTLAKRLHMSTSTLHRYCNGDAVPADYAPVERLARLCKASPAELVALHRRWVLADADRGRKPSAAPRPDPGPGLAPGLDPDTGLDPENEPEPESEPEPAPAPEPTPAPDASAELTVTARGAVTSPAGGARRRVRRAALAVLVVCAVAGVIAVGANLAAPRGDDARDGAAGAVSAADGTTPGTAEGTGSGSPSPSPSPARPSGSATGAPGAGRTTSPAPSETAGGDTATGIPLTVTTQPYSWTDPCSQHYLVDQPPAKVAPPPLEADASAWVRAAGAVSAGEQFVTLTVQGTGEETVVLDSLVVRMAGRRTPLAWSDYAMGYPGVGCGGNVPTHSFTVALDATRPAVAPVAGQRDFPFKVSESDPVVFHITADASAYDVSWYLELSWTSGSRHGGVTVDDTGRPFRTSGSNGRPAYEFPLHGDGWVEAGTTVP